MVSQVSLARLRATLVLGNSLVVAGGWGGR